MYFAEIEKRYDAVLRKLEQIQNEEGMPIEAITGSMYGDLYRMIDGCAQQYVMLKMPQQIPKLRQALRGKLIQLARIQSEQH